MIETLLWDSISLPLLGQFTILLLPYTVLTSVWTAPWFIFTS